GSTPPLPGPNAEALDAATRELDRLAAATPAEAPWDAPGAVALDRMSAAEWLQRSVPDPLAQAVLKMSFAVSFTMSTDQILMLVVAAFVAGTGGWDGCSLRLTYRARGGTARVPERIAERLGERVTLSSPVRRVRRFYDGVEIACDDRTISADRLIVA